MDVFDLSAKISLDSSEYSKGLKDAESEGSSVASKLGGGLKTAAKIGGAAIAAAGTAVGALATKSVQSFGQYEQLVGGVETLFKKSAGQVQKYADEAYKTAGVSANKYMETVTSFSASLLQGLGGDTDKAAKLSNEAIVDMSDNANKMGTSMESIQNAYQGFAKQNYTMLDNLKLGYGGTQQEMYRLLSDAAKLDKTFGESAKFSIDSKGHLTAEFADMIQAIHIVQENMGITGTTSKEAATTIEGSINTMKSAWENLVTGLGNGNADLSGLINQFIESVKTVWGNIQPVLTQTLQGIGTLITEMLPQILNEVPKLISDVLPKLAEQGIKMVYQIGEGLMKSAPLLMQAALKILDILTKGISENAPKMIPMAVEAIMNLAQSLIDNAPKFIESAIVIIQAIAQGLGNAIPIILEKLPTLINSLISGILQSIPLIVQAGVQLLVGLIQGLPQAITQILSALPMLIDSIISGILTALPLIVDAGIQLLSALTQNMPVIIDKVVNSLPMIIDSIVSGLLGALPQIVDAGLKLFMALMQSMPQILIAVGKATPKIIKTLIYSLIKAIPQVVSAGKKILTSIFKSIPEALTYIGKALGDVKDAIVDSFADFNLIQTGKDLIEGLWKGISDMGKWIADKLKGFGEGIVNTVEKIFGVNSPSRVFAEIGGYLAEGLGNGWEDEYPDVKKQITNDLDFSAKPIKMAPHAQALRGDMSSMTQAIVNAISDNSNISIELNNRELGRAVRSYV